MLYYTKIISNLPVSETGLLVKLITGNDLYIYFSAFLRRVHEAALCVGNDEEMYTSILLPQNLFSSVVSCLSCPVL